TTLSRLPSSARTTDRMISPTCRAAFFPSSTFMSLPSLPRIGLPSTLGMCPDTYSVSPTRTVGTSVAPDGLATLGRSRPSFFRRASWPSSVSAATAGFAQRICAPTHPRPAPAARHTPPVSQRRRFIVSLIAPPLLREVGRLQVLAVAAEAELARL